MLKVTDLDGPTLRDGLILCAVVAKTEPRALTFQVAFFFFYF